MSLFGFLEKKKIGKILEGQYEELQYIGIAIYWDCNILGMQYEERETGVIIYVHIQPP